jgi:copper homeostasis protein CutC
MIRRVREVLDSSLLHVMIRPRAGDFVYTDDDIQVSHAILQPCKRIS